MAERKLRWMRLDNAAKIYPAARRRGWNNMFRISMTLSETIDQAILQSALDVTVRRFPSIAVRVRRGVFWYYLEELEQAPQVAQEVSHPLAHRRFSEIRRCAFRVIAYENRIAAEFFHAVTDGTGGMIFLKTLVAEYLTQKYGAEIPVENGILDRQELPREAELTDSFLENEGPVARSRKEENAFFLDGKRESDGFLHLTTGILDVNEALRLAKSHHVSLTVLLASIMALSILEIQKQHISNPLRRKPVKVLIPVNLRKLFGSETLRNFALYITPSIDPRMGEYSLEEVLRLVHHQLGADLNEKEMRARITTNVRSEKSIFVKLAPLFLKNFIMKFVYTMVGERKSCISVSNLGAIVLPEEMKNYVNRIDFVLGVQAICHHNCGVLSYGNQLVINLIRNTEDPILEQEFFTRLRRLGLHVYVESNQR